MNIFKDKKILVTGGAGFIGSHLVAELKKQGGRVTVIDKNLKQDLKKFIYSGGLKKNFDYILHFAGSASVDSSINSPLDDFEVNLLNTLLLLESLRNLKKKPFLIFASTAAVYGIPKKMPVSEESQTIPVSPYGASKLAAENYIRVYGKLYNIPSIILRFFSVYGPGQKKQVIYDLMTKLKKNPSRLEVYGSPEQTMDLIYIDDLIKAIIITTQRGDSGEVYNIASGKSIKIEEVVKNLCRAFKINPKIAYIKEPRPGANLKWRVDISKIRQLGFRSETSLEIGLAAIKNWFEKDFNKGLKNR